MSELYTETSVTRDIFEIINLALDLKQNASIIGEPGVGKTSALRAYVHQNKWAHLFTATAVTGNALRDLFREIADILGIYASGSIADMQRQMLRYDFSGMVLIIDEAQNLKLQAFRELLNLWDFTGLCLVFAGNNEVLKRVKTDKGAFAQISRRVKLRSELNSITDDDADRIASLYGVNAPDSLKLVRAIGAAFQADGVAAVLQIAKRDVGGKPLRAIDIRTTCEALPHYRSVLK